MAVIDLKTANRKPSQIDLSYQLQLELYACQGDIKKAFIHYAIKTKKPKTLVLEHELPEEKRLLKVVSSVAQAIQEAIRTGNFIPNGLGHSWACQYCGYRERGLCPYCK
jgi:CRISPR/Cas system-associated exonuclease Cas4 (RecB family)